MTRLIVICLLAAAPGCVAYNDQCQPLVENPNERVAFIAKGTELWRIYYRGGSHPMAWNEFRSAGPPSGRFDQRGLTTGTPGRKILYAARDLHTPFAECFQRTRVIDRTLPAGNPSSAV